LKRKRCVVTDISEAREFLEALVKASKADNSRSDKRHQLFDALILGFSLSVLSVKQEATLSFLPKFDRSTVDRLTSAKNTGFGKLLGQTISKIKPSSIGVHIVDPALGRLSQIWLPDNPNFRKSGPLSSLLYPMLWLAVYKGLLHPSTSLINSYERELIQWPGPRLIIEWGEAKESKERSTARSTATTGKNRTYRANETRFVNLRNAVTDAFITNSLNALRRVDALLNEASGTLVDQISSPHPAEKTLKPAQIENWTRSLIESEGILEQVRRLGDERNLLILHLIQSPESRSSFNSLLDQLGIRTERRAADQETDDWSLNGNARRSLREGVEVFQTILFNSPTFSKDAICVLRRRMERSRIYLVLGANKLPAETALADLHYLTRLLVAAVEHKDTNFNVAPTEAPPDDQTVTEIRRILSFTKKYPYVRGVERFLLFCVELSKISIHEGHELSFFIGFGHADVPEFHIRQRLQFPDHLTNDSVDLPHLVHFVKAHFNAFTQGGSVLWFDEGGGCHGSYIRPDDEPRVRWLHDWEDGCLFVEIKKKGQFDVLEVEPNQTYRPRVRVIGGKVVDLQSTSAIEKQIALPMNWVFSDEKQRLYVTHVVQEVAKLLRETTSEGAGLVIANLSEEINSDWRVPLIHQVKSLVPKLREHIHEHKWDLTNRKKGESVKSLVQRICQQALLDGAVFIKVLGNTIVSDPACHFIPLIEENGLRKLLDFYALADEGARSAEVADREAVSAAFPKEGIASLFSTGEKSPKELLDYCHRFAQLGALRTYTAAISGIVPNVNRNFTPGLRKEIRDLAFLTSSGTRHHSLWGISLSSKNPVLVVTISKDGRTSVFWDGRRIVAPSD